MAGPQHAEDVLQDAFLRALRAYPRLRHAEHLRAWLFRVTTTAAIDAHRSRPRELPVAELPAVGVEDDYDSGAFEALIAPPCLLYTSDAAADLLCVDLGGRR